MRFGYTAKIKGSASEAEQREALVEIGASKIIDEGEPHWPPKPRRPHRPQLADLISILREGDQLCVYSARHLARNAGDLFRALAAVTAKGASVYVVDMADDFTADESHARIADAFAGDKRRAQTEAARNAPRKNRGGRPPALTLNGADLAEFKRMWRDGAVDREMIARRFGCSVATVVRRAGDLKLGAKA